MPSPFTPIQCAGNSVDQESGSSSLKLVKTHFILDSTFGSYFLNSLLSVHKENQITQIEIRQGISFDTLIHFPLQYIPIYDIDSGIYLNVWHIVQRFLQDSEIYK